MRVLVPFDARRPKTRLADALDEDDREAFARVMLRDVLAAVRATGREPEVLATAPVDVEAAVTVDERPLSDAVNVVLTRTNEPVAVVMADLALATSSALEELFETAGDVVFAPGRGGGTNAIVTRHPEFRVDYHGVSYLDHLRAARNCGATVAVVDSHRLATDVDERADFAEVLIHGEGRSREWLRAHGFELTPEAGRTDVTRTS